jgi:hypothetical protein
MYVYMYSFRFLMVILESNGCLYTHIFMYIYIYIYIYVYVYMYRKLCVLLDCKSIYLSLAEILGDFPNLEFVSYMVQTLNLILLTAPELFVLRNILKNCFNAKKKGLYSYIFMHMCLFIYIYTYI